MKPYKSGVLGYVGLTIPALKSYCEGFFYFKDRMFFCTIGLN